MELLTSKIYKKRDLTPSIIQFGDGNFLRGFVDYFVKVFNDKDIFKMQSVVVQATPLGKSHELAKQDYLYTMFIRGLKDNKQVDEHMIIDTIKYSINPYVEYDKYLELAKCDSFKYIISNTTEAGIRLDLTEKDIFKIAPNSFPGKLLALLYTRYKHVNGDIKKGYDILPCELIDNNGLVLEEYLIELAKHHKLEEKFIKWISEANRFYNTLVDRIVPGYPKEEKDELEKKLGYIDNFMVVGEVFHLWVIENPRGLDKVFDSKKAGLNILFVDSIKPYKELKVKILNGAHTVLMPVSYLLGIQTVKEAILNPRINKYVKTFIYDYVLPILDVNKEEKDEFAKNVLERYLNPFIKHYLLSISLNSMSKYQARIIPTITKNLSNNIFPKEALFSFACFIKLYEQKLNGVCFEIRDDEYILKMYKELWDNFKNTPEYISHMVSTVINTCNFEILKEKEVFNFICESLKDICDLGVDKALSKIGY